MSIAHPVVPLRSVEQLTQLYQDVLAPSFPPAELVPLDAFLADHAAGRLESLGAVEPDGAAHHGAAGAGRVVAGVVGAWSPRSRVLLVVYLAIAPGHRGGGIGATLLRAAVSRWVEDLRPDLVLGEVEHPQFHTASEAHGDPHARLRFYARHGGRLLAVPYFQPANSPGGERVPALLLMTLATRDPDVSSVPAAPLRAFLREYFEESEGGVADDGPTRALFAAVSGESVALFGVEELGRVPVGLLDESSLRAPTAR
jgi:GNAT superfamily N-acetyltransferase